MTTDLASLRLCPRFVDPSKLSADPPLSYLERERLRGAANELLADPSASPAVRADAAELILRALFDRSLSLQTSREHPPFAEFVRVFDVEGTFSSDVASQLRSRFGPSEASDHMPKGDAYWRS